MWLMGTSNATCPKINYYLPLQIYEFLRIFKNDTIIYLIAPLIKFHSFIHPTDIRGMCQ